MSSYFHRNRSSATAKSNANILRKNPTSAEQRLWHYLRKRSLNNIKFRRQEAVGNYVVDFISYDKLLIIEIDGETHSSDSSIIYDNKREQFLISMGYRVVRFWNNDIYDNIEIVLAKIYELTEN